VGGFGVEFVVAFEDPPRTGDFGRSASISESRDCVSGWEGGDCQ
jgi:hypothetical protein